MSDEFLKFPDGFLWGAGSAPHQVEGNTHNNWSEWELKNAEKLAARAFKNFSWLPNWKEIESQATNPKNYISGQATDHYNRFEEDFTIAKELGMTMHRLGFEWSRIEPEPGKFNEEEIYHYKKVIKSLLDKGITPMVTLWHWTFPVWVSDMGGWRNMETIKYFSRFVEFVVGLFPEVKYWITLNEPEIYAREAYLIGKWPPQRRSRLRYFQIINNMIMAHNDAYEYIRSVSSEVQVGIAQNNTYFEPYKNRLINKVIAGIFSFWGNRYFLDRTKDHLDFIGLNYYFHHSINFWNEHRIRCQYSDIGWEVCAYGIYYVLKELEMYDRPIFITENGVADSKDYLRESFIKDTLKYVHQAIQEGINVRGYLHWAMTDNFEWDKGFWPRFGLVEIDYDTMERKIRPSAYKYAEIIKNNGFQATII